MIDELAVRGVWNLDGVVCGRGMVVIVDGAAWVQNACPPYLA